MKPFEVLLAESARAHGHMCPGQIVGVRMAMLGCRLVGLDDPTRREQIKKLIVYVEMDRCAADAVSYVAGVKLGRRSLKFMDYGIMAAAFFNLERKRAFRVLSTEEARDLAPLYAPEVAGKVPQQLAAYKRMPDSVLFKVQSVHVKLDPCDLPGPTRRKVACTRCGQVVRDRREAYVDNQPVCRPCLEESYFTHAREIAWPEMNWSPEDPDSPYREVQSDRLTERSPC